MKQATSTEAQWDHHIVASDIPGTQSIRDHHKTTTLPKRLHIEHPIIDESQTQKGSVMMQETSTSALPNNSMGSTTTSTISRNHASNAAPSSPGYQGCKTVSSP
jgi:hypothetical protein